MWSKFWIFLSIASASTTNSSMSHCRISVKPLFMSFLSYWDSWNKLLQKAYHSLIHLKDKKTPSQIQHKIECAAMSLRYKNSMCYSGLWVCLVCVGPYHPLPHDLDQVLHRLSSILGMCLCMVYPYRPLPHHLDQVLHWLSSILGMCLCMVYPYRPLPHYLDQVLLRLRSILGMSLRMVYPYRPLPHHLDQVLLRLKSVLTKRRHACQRRTSGKVEERTPCKPVFAKRNVMQTKSAVRTHHWKAPQMHKACNKKLKTCSGGRWPAMHALL